MLEQWQKALPVWWRLFIPHSLALLPILLSLHAAQQTSEVCKLILSLCIALTTQIRYAQGCKNRYVIATDAENQDLLQSRHSWQRFINWQAALNSTRKV